MQQLSRPPSVCGLLSTSKQLWSRAHSRPPPSLPLPDNVRTVSSQARRPWPRKIRKVPMRNTYPQYDLSGLILDLDAEGTKHVRKYDPNIDGIPDPSRTVQSYEHLALTERVQAFEDRYKRDTQRYEEISTKRHIPWHVSDLDIITCALLGPSLKDGSQSPSQEEPWSSKIEEMENVHHWNGIPRHAQTDAARGVSYLMRRQRMAVDVAGNMDIEIFLRQIGKCENLTELKRIIRILLQSREGRELVSAQSQGIAKRCRALELTASRDELKELLAFLNDMTIKLASEGLPVSPQFAGIGLRIAASYGAFSAMQMYFASADSWRVEEMASYLNTSLSRALLFLTSQPGHEKGQSEAQESRASRVAAYTTLTGYGLEDRNLGISYQKTMRKRKNASIRHYRHFLHILAEIGAFRTIWHEFRNSGSQLPSSTLQEWFVSAILRAFRNVESGRITFPPLALLHASGYYEDDTKFDLQTIMSSSIHTRPAKAPYAGTIKFPGLPENANLNNELTALYDNLTPQTTCQQRRDDILDALCQEDIRDAMWDLRAILYRPTEVTLAEVEEFGQKN